MKQYLVKILLGLCIVLWTVETATAQQSVDTPEKSSQSKILIAYFSHSGNTRLIAHDIQKLIGGDIFEIKSSQQYAPDFDTAVEQAREDLRKKARPKLAEQVHNMRQYKVIFLGFPNWVGTMPMIVFSFLEQHDFKGKIIVPFCTHGTSGISNTITDLKDLNLQANIQQYIGIYRNDVRTAEPALSKWLRDLGYLHF